MHHFPADTNAVRKEESRQ